MVLFGFCRVLERALTGFFGRSFYERRFPFAGFGGVGIASVFVGYLWLSGLGVNGPLESSRANGVPGTKAHSGYSVWGVRGVVLRLDT